MKIRNKKYIEQDSLDYWDLSIPDTHNYVLSNGAVVHNCGVGFSVQKQHIKKLPKIQKRTKQAKTFVIPDSIEGWAEAVQVLMQSFFVEESEWRGRKIYFDLSEIRPKGSEISGGFKAPGPDPLRKALDLIEKKLSDTLKDCPEPCSLNTLAAYDIVMYVADAVISGGVRRAASICLFSHDDEDMITCKTGDWFIENPQRGRSNNSAVLLRNSTQFEEFKGIMDSVKHSGEPGFVWTDDLDILFNPCVEVGMYGYLDKAKTKSGWQMCVASDTKLIHKDGIDDIKTLAKNKVEVEIWNGSEYKKVVPFQTGDDDRLHRVHFGDGSYLDATDNHKFLIKNRFEQEYKTLNTIDLIEELKNTKYAIHVPRANFDRQAFEGKYEKNAYEYGFILGDGTVRKRVNKNSSVVREPIVSIFDGSNKEYIKFNNIREISKKGKEQVCAFEGLNNELAFDIKYSKGLPKHIKELNAESLLAFFAGWLDADGTNAGKTVTLGGDEYKLRDAQLLLTKIGINSSISLSYKKGNNTIIQGRQVNRNQDLWVLRIHKTIDIPCQRLTCENQENAKIKGKFQTIINIEELDGLHESYCLTEPETGQCVFNNVLTLQCNLTEINGSKAITPEEFYEQCKAASILGTIQAGYTGFNYVSDITKQIVDREALIGVGITGWMNNPNVLFDKKVQKKGAEIVKKYNKIISDLIGINQAARTTVVKPSGNASVLLGCASGIHGEHSPRYIRHVQMNKDTEVGQLFAKENPQMVEDSVWSDLDYVIGFPIEPKKGSIYKEDLLGVKQLEYVRNAQENWIEFGTNPELCVKPFLKHNVSNTITVDDWDEVTDYIFKHRNSLCGVSLLSAAGDKAYPQAPFTEVLNHRQIVKKYGEKALFTSALIEAGLNAFHNDLWTAISTCLGYGEKLTEDHKDLLKRDFTRRFAKFASNFEDKKKLKMLRKTLKADIDLRDSTAEYIHSLTDDEMLNIDDYYYKTYDLLVQCNMVDNIEKQIQDELDTSNNLCADCLKDVYNLHKWWRITNNAKDINWVTDLGKKDFVSIDTLGSQGCSGGACEIEF